MLIRVIVDSFNRANLYTGLLNDLTVQQLNISIDYQLLATNYFFK